MGIFIAFMALFHLGMARIAQKQDAFAAAFNKVLGSHVTAGIIVAANNGVVGLGVRFTPHHNGHSGGRGFIDFFGAFALTHHNNTVSALTGDKVTGPVVAGHKGIRQQHFIARGVQRFI